MTCIITASGGWPDLIAPTICTPLSVSVDCGPVLILQTTRRTLAHQIGQPAGPFVSFLVYPLLWNHEERYTGPGKEAGLWERAFQCCSSVFVVYTYFVDYFSVSIQSDRLRHLLLVASFSFAFALVLVSLPARKISLLGPWALGVELWKAHM